MTLIKKGAEANLLLEEFKDVLHPGGGGKVLVKHRISKNYRVKELDLSLRDFRTSLESKLLVDAKKAGVPTPIVYQVDRIDMKIVMEYIEGHRVKSFLEDIDSQKRLDLCKQIGRQTAQLHKAGIIHGDLTTSNMIQTPKGRIYFIDFGLGEYDRSIESRATDLHLLHRTVQSTHFRVAEDSFEAVLESYKKEFGDGADEIIERIDEIERRGRYIPKEERKSC